MKPNDLSVLSQKCWLEMIIRDSKQLKGQLTILQSHNTEKNLTWYLTASILLDEKSLDKIGLDKILNA